MAAKVKKSVVVAAAAVEQPVADEGDASPPPEVRTVRSSQCPSVSGQSTITYEFGLAVEGRPMFRVTANTGGGMFGKGWVSMDRVLAELKDPSNSDAISARAFRDVFLGMSINTQSFLLAALLREGVVIAHPDKPRGYQVFDVPGFEARMEALGSASPEATPAVSEPDKRPVLKLAKKTAPIHKE